MGEDLVRKEREKGMKRKEEIWRNEVKNEMIKVVKIIGMKL